MSDVFFADQICYVETDTTINRDATVCMSFRNAVALLRRSFLFQYHQQMSDEASAVRAALEANLTILDPDFPDCPYKSARLRELNLDNFLIGTFFEIAAKAAILERGYLVHKIKSTPKSDPTYVLRMAQRTTPVSASEYRDLDPFVDNGNGRNGMQRLHHATLDYSWVYDGDYVNILPFSDEFIRLAREYRHFRNLIHFPLIGASESIMDIELESLDHYEVINSEIETVIRPMFDRLMTGLIAKFTLEI